jgi:hypothetical protein
VTRPLNRDPLAGTTKLFVDGTNLLHALTSGPGDRQPPAAVIGRLRGAIPAETAITLVFDGPPEMGVRGERIAGGLTVRYAGRRTADEVLLQLVNDAATWSDEPGSGASSVLVVTDDRDLRDSIQRRGGRSAGTKWLIGRLERPRLSAPSVGNPRPPKPPHVPQEAHATDATGDNAAPRWSPGRGATTKKGNARRTSKARKRG